MGQCGIYCYQNKINNKKYIGQSVDLNRRKRCFRENGRYSSCLLQNAIKKYGVDNFQYSVLTHCKKEDLNYYEKYYISRLKTNVRDYGYNLTSGGDSQYFRDDEWKRKIKDTWTNERKDEWSKTHSGKGNGNYGKRWNSVQRAHASKIRIDNETKKFLQIHGFSLSELPNKIHEYLSMHSDATKKDVINYFHISYKRLNKAMNTECDLKAFLKKTLKQRFKENAEKNNNNRKRAVVQCDINNHDIILNIFSSIGEAIRLTGIESIKHCVYGKQSQGCGYFWRFAIDGEKASDVINKDYLKPLSHNKLSSSALEKLMVIGSRKKPNLYKKVYCYSSSGNLTKIYDSVKGTKMDGFSAACVSQCCSNKLGTARTHKGYVFSHEKLTVNEVRLRFK